MSLSIGCLQLETRVQYFRCGADAGGAGGEKDRQGLSMSTRNRPSGNTCRHCFGNSHEINNSSAKIILSKASLLSFHTVWPPAEVPAAETGLSLLPYLACVRFAGRTNRRDSLTNLGRCSQL